LQFLQPKRHGMTTTGIFQINKRMIKKCGLLRMMPGNMYVPMSSSIISQCAHLWSFRYAFNHLIWNGRENQKCVCIQKVKCKIYPCNLLVSGLLPFASLHSYILKYCFTYLWLHHVTTLLCMTNDPFKVLLQVCNNNACCESLVQLDVYLDLQGHYQKQFLLYFQYILPLLLTVVRTLNLRIWPSPFFAI